MIEQASTNTPVPCGPTVQVYFRYPDCGCWGFGAATGWNGTSTWESSHDGAIRGPIPKGGSEG